MLGDLSYPKITVCTGVALGAQIKFIEILVYILYICIYSMLMVKDALIDVSLSLYISIYKYSMFIYIYFICTTATDGPLLGRKLLKC